MSRRLPLADVRVVAVEQFGAGPWGSLQLADLGAEIIKIEDPTTGGDIARYVPPYTKGEDSLFFETFNRGKRSVALDMRTAAGRAVFEDLVRNADAVYSNLRGDTPAKLRITYDDLKHVNPAVVCCSLSGFGMTGPRTKEPSYDYILQAMAGWMEFTGEPDGPPTRSGPSVVDYSTGFVAALSLLAGVHGARRDGVGMDCDVSLFDTAIALLAYLGTWSLNTDFVPERMPRSAHPTLVPFQAFQASDGWLIVGCGKEKFFRRLLDVLGRSDLADRDGFGDFAARKEHRDEVVAALDPLFATDTVDGWVAKLRAIGVPCGPVQSVERALRDEQTEAREMVVGYEHPVFGEVRVPGTSVQAGESQPRAERAPRRGEHQREVLTELLGYDEARLAELARAGAFGAAE